VFSFGDSLADTGNYRFFHRNDSDPVLQLPYGETFFHRTTGLPCYKSIALETRYLAACLKGSCLVLVIE
jgi:hypothetical protein